MPIRNAIHLLNAIDENTDLRKRMYSYSNTCELMGYLDSQGYSFDLDEFEDAVTSLHVKCQTFEDAQELLQKADWLRYLIVTNQKTEI